MIMENEKIGEPLERLGVNERIRRLKHWLVFITFGVPMFFFLLNLLIWVIREVDTPDYKKNFNSTFVCISSHRSGLTSIQIRFSFN